MNRSILAFAFLVLSSVMTSAQAANPAEGRVSFETCNGCHSTPSYSNIYPTYHVPKIGGQRAEYIQQALQAYRDEARPHRTMQANSKTLSQADLENIAAYVQATAGNKDEASASGNADAGKKLAQSCVSCHNNDLKAGGNVPILAGQYPSYLIRAISDYQSGTRKNALMQSMVENLSEQDVENIAAYFAGMEGLSTVE